MRRLTNGLFGIHADETGVYLVHFPTDERVCLVLLTKDGVAAAGNGSEIESQLSERELQVFGMIGNGIPMDEIAGQLGLSVKTIETYRNRIKKKLGIKSRTRLVMLAVEWAITNRRRSDNS